MKQFFAVFQYELGTYLKKRTFQVVTLLLMLAIAVGMTLPRFFAGGGEAASGGGGTRGRDDRGGDDRRRRYLGAVPEPGLWR